MRILIPALLLICLTGCASTSPSLDGLRQSAAIETLFVYGTLKAIEQASEPAEKAERIRAIAQDLLELTEGESIRSEIVQRLIDEALEGRNLSPADRYLVHQITPLAASYAGADGLIVGERLEALRGFLGDVIEATRLYGA